MNRNYLDVWTCEVLTDTIVFWLRQHIWPVSIPQVIMQHNNVTLSYRNKDFHLSSKEESIELVSLFDITGRRISSYQVNNNEYTLFTGSLPPDIYILQVSGKGYIQSFKIKL